MKTKIAVLCILLAVLTATAVIVLLLTKHYAKNNILDGPDMIREDTFDFSRTYLCRVYYWHGGGSLGDSSSLELTIEPDEEGRPVVQIVSFDQPGAGEKAVEKTVRSSSYVVDGVQDIIDRYGMTEWVDLPPSEEFALDAPTTSLSYEYSDGTSFSIGSDDELPEDGYRAIREIRDYIMTCAGIGKQDP